MVPEEVPVELNHVSVLQRVVGQVSHDVVVQHDEGTALNASDVVLKKRKANSIVTIARHYWNVPKQLQSVGSSNLYIIH